MGLGGGVITLSRKKKRSSTHTSMVLWYVSNMEDKR